MDGSPARAGLSVSAETAPVSGGDRSWLDSAPVMIWVADVDQNCSWLNAAWSAFTGRPSDAELGSGWTSGVHRGDLERCLSVRRAAWARREPFRTEYRLRRADGQFRWVDDTGAPHHAPDGAFLGFIGACMDVHDRRLAEIEQSAVRERLSLAQAAGGVGVWEYDVAGQRLTWTAEQKRLFGLPEGAPPPAYADFIASVHPDDREPMRQAAAGAWATGGYEVEFRRPLPGTGLETAHSYIARGRVLRDAAGQPVRVVGVNVDVTARRAADDRRAILADLGELLQAELDDRALFHAVSVLLGSRLRASACAFYELDYDARLMRFHPVWAAPEFPVLGTVLPLGDYDPVLERLQSGQTVAVADVRDDPRIDRRYREVLIASRTEAFVTVPLRRDGAMSSCLTLLSSKPRAWSGDDVELVRVVAERTWLAVENQRLAAERDRTVAELLEAREALAQEVARRTQERNRVFDLSRELIAVLELDGRARAVNPAWSELLGRSEAEILTRPLAALIHPDDRAAAARRMEALRAGQPVTRYENRIRTAGGAWRWMAWTAVSDGEAAYIVGRDVTAEREAAESLREANARLEAEIAERARMQEQLVQAQKMEAVGQLTGGVAHDFNNLLQVITGALQLIDVADPVRRARLTDAMRQAARRGEDLTRQLLAFSRRSALKPERLDLAAHVEGMRELLDRSLRGDIRVETRFAAELSAVEVDAGELQLALLNVAVNARDAMPAGGVIRITGEEVERLDDELSGRFVRLSVSDTGVGMPPEVLGRVFEPFFTTKEVGKGSGLGLSQVYGFARQSGGGVRIQSRPGEGATVSLYLPCAQGPAPRRDLDPARGIAGPLCERVLLVEDDDAVAGMVQEMIASLGVRCRRAADPSAALDLLRIEAVDLMLSDIVMPGGVSGLDLAREARRRRPGLPVVLATGFSSAAAEARAEGLTVLNKPYTLDALRSVLAAAGREGAA